MKPVFPLPTPAGFPGLGAYFFSPKPRKSSAWMRPSPARANPGFSAQVRKKRLLSHLL